MQLNPMSAMQQTVEDGIGKGGDVGAT